jgi:hypothetical protein
VPPFDDPLKDKRRATAKAWRAVEAQHQVSTLRLVNHDPLRQEHLERILEQSKPPLPEDTETLHYLLATPFRYPPSKHGSRFRAWPDPGVLYGAKLRRTACAEMGYWRWRFLTDSDGLTEIPASAQTVFQLGVNGNAIRLAQDPTWMDPISYQNTQALARQAREQQIDWIGYHSVRDQPSGYCYAVLQPSAIRPRQPLEMETWYLTVTRAAVLWQRDRERYIFTAERWH